MRRVLGAGLAALVLLGVVLVVRGLRLSSPPVDASPAPPLALDAAAIAGRVAESLRYETVSSYDRARMDAEVFRAFHAFLARSYPAAHAALARERVAELTLLYTWRGRDPSLRPVLFLGHQDVVPVEPATAGEWEHAPFAGRIADGYVWGRGALDDKTDLLCLLEAVEHLVAEGFAPERTLHLAFGHDEEVGGDAGAAAVAERLGARGVRLEYVLDEGGGFATDALPGLEGPVAPIAIAEKGSVSFELVAEARGGHSSVPPRHTATGLLAGAVHRLERSPMPAHLDGTLRTTLEALAPALGLPAQIVVGNLWLFGPAVRHLGARQPALDALMRTTTAVTILEAGVKANVVPGRALAVVNHRIRPGETVEDVRRHVLRTVDDPRVSIVGTRGTPRAPSPVSRTDSAAFAAIRRTVAEVFPEAVLLPTLSPGGTDARFFYPLSENVYRLTPLVVSREDLERIHGVGERVPVAALSDAVRFYVRLIRRTAR